MIADKYSVLRRFQFHEDAADLVEKLREAGIHAEVIDNSPSFDVTFTQANPTIAQYEVKVHQKHFANAKEIQQGMAREEITEIAAEHYLHEFSDEELLDLLKAEEEWSEYDVIAARLILTERKVTIPEAEITQAKEEALRQQREQIRVSNRTLITGYILAPLGMFFSVIAFIPFLLGCYFIMAKKTLSTGEKIRMYDDFSRKHGMAFVGLCIVFFVLWLSRMHPEIWW